MKKTRLSILTLVVAGIIALSGSGIVAAASYGINMDYTCENEYGGQYRGYLQYNNVLGWRCKNVVWGSDIKTVNIQMYNCDVYHYGTTATWTNYNDPGSWKCTN